MALILSMGIVTALWLAGPAITGNATTSITSSNPSINLTKQLTNFTALDVTYNGVEFNNSLDFQTEVNGIGQVTFDVTKTPTDNRCTDYLNDCTVKVFEGDPKIGYGFSYPTEIFNGSNITLFASQEKSLQVRTSCQKQSCPQNISIELNVQLLE